MTPVFLSLFLVVIALLPYVLRTERAVRVSAAVAAILAAVGAVVMVAPAFTGAAIQWNQGAWYVDAFTAYVVSLIAIVYIAATLVSVRYIKHEHHEGILSLGNVRLYFSLLHVFVLTMFVAVLADNVVLMWIALEGTTLSTTMLVALYKKDASIEAAWKYIILCSTGISLGLVGVLMTSYAATVGGAGEHAIFSLHYLREHATALDPAIMRWAFIFILIGLGTKVGFVPMHTWLPDAHSKTPSPISAMLSGILLNVALAVVLRFKTLTDGSLGTSDWTESLFIVFGILSLLLPAFVLLIQQNYKRMLAYSSVEHMGLIAFAIGLGPAGLVAALMHMAGHMLAKSMLFFTAGELFLQWKTTKIDLIRNAWKQSPYTAALFLLGILTILAAPPTALFASEYLILREGFVVHPWLSLILVGALTMVLIGMMRPTVQMLFAAAASDAPAQLVPARERWRITHTIAVCQLVACIALGVWFFSPSGIAFMQTIAFAVRALDV